MVGKGRPNFQDQGLLQPLWLFIVQDRYTVLLLTVSVLTIPCDDAKDVSILIKRVSHLGVGC